MVIALCVSSALAEKICIGDGMVLVLAFVFCFVNDRNISLASFILKCAAGAFLEQAQFGLLGSIANLFKRGFFLIQGRNALGSLVLLLSSLSVDFSLPGREHF